MEDKELKVQVAILVKLSQILTLLIAVHKNDLTENILKYISDMEDDVKKIIKKKKK